MLSLVPGHISKFFIHIAITSVSRIISIKHNAVFPGTCLYSVIGKRTNRVEVENEKKFPPFKSKNLIGLIVSQQFTVRMPVQIHSHVSDQSCLGQNHPENDI